jgi:hypothetical protein
VVSAISLRSNVISCRDRQTRDPDRPAESPKPESVDGGSATIGV